MVALRSERYPEGICKGTGKIQEEPRKMGKG
jgi:hypothetical protein